MDTKSLFSLSLGYHSKQIGDECLCWLSLCHASQLHRALYKTGRILRVRQTRVS